MGDACDVGEQCVDPNSSCIDGACQCKVNYIASLDGINCIPSKSKSNMNKKPVGFYSGKKRISALDVGEDCVQDQQCPDKCVERICT
jgi:EB module